jgi:hypothetical protein
MQDERHHVSTIDAAAMAGPLLREMTRIADRGNPPGTSRQRPTKRPSPRGAGSRPRSNVRAHRS